MNPQKNQGADDAPLLRDLQLEVSQESAPLLQFMLRHAGLIAGVLVLFLLVLIGTGIYNWHGDSRAEEARDALARTLIQNQGADQVKALSQLAEGAPSSTRFAAYMALAHSALEAHLVRRQRQIGEVLCLGGSDPHERHATRVQHALDQALAYPLQALPDVRVVVHPCMSLNMVWIERSTTAVNKAPLFG